LAHSSTRRPLTWGLLWVLLITAAGAQAASIDTGYKQAASQLSETDQYRLALLRLKSHLSIARGLLQLRATGADYHLGTALKPTFEQIEPELERRGAPFTNDTLIQLRRATDAPPAAALTTIDSAAAAVDGSFAQTGPLAAAAVLSLAETLLREAVHWYGEAVTDNEVVDLRRYRNGRGLVLQAEALIRHSTGVKGEAGHEALVAAVVLIRQAWPGYRPPPIVFDPQSVAERLDQAITLLNDFA